MASGVCSVPGLGADDVITLVLDQVVAHVPGPDVGVLVGVLGHRALCSCTVGTFVNSTRYCRYSPIYSTYTFA
jgi:hypothetical protein